MQANLVNLVHNKACGTFKRCGYRSSTKMRKTWNLFLRDWIKINVKRFYK